MVLVLVNYNNNPVVAS